MHRVCDLTKTQEGSVQIFGTLFLYWNSQSLLKLLPANLESQEDFYNVLKILYPAFHYARNHQRKTGQP